MMMREAHDLVCWPTRLLSSYIEPKRMNFIPGRYHTNKQSALFDPVTE